MFDAVKRCRPVPLRAAAALVAAALCVVVTTRAAAITYRVLNHPDGGSITDHDPDKVGTEGWLGQAVRQMDPDGENPVMAVNVGQGLLALDCNVKRPLR